MDVIFCVTILTVVSIRIPLGERVMGQRSCPQTVATCFNSHPARRAGDGLCARYSLPGLCFNSHPARRAGDGANIFTQAALKGFNSHPARRAGDGAR